MPFFCWFFFLMQIFIAAFVLAHSRADILLHSIYQYMSSFKWYSFAQSNHFKLTLFTSISLTAQRRTDVLRTIFFLRLLNTFSFAISIWIREWTLSSIFLASRMDFVRFFFQLNFSHFFSFGAVIWFCSLFCRLRQVYFVSFRSVPFRSVLLVYVFSLSFWLTLRYAWNLVSFAFYLLKNMDNLWNILMQNSRDFLWTTCSTSSNLVKAKSQFGWPEKLLTLFKTMIYLILAGQKRKCEFKSALTWNAQRNKKADSISSVLFSVQIVCCASKSISTCRLFIEYGSFAFESVALRLLILQQP